MGANNHFFLLGVESTKNFYLLNLVVRSKWIMCIWCLHLHWLLFHFLEKKQQRNVFWKIERWRWHVQPKADRQESYRCRKIALLHFTTLCSIVRNEFVVFKSDLNSKYWASESSIWTDSTSIWHDRACWFVLHYNFWNCEIKPKYKDLYF